MPETCGCKLLEWTDKKPTEEGVYAFCAPSGAWRTTVVVHVTKRDDGCWVDQGSSNLYPMARYPDGRWLGPLPALPRTQEAE